MQHRKHTPFVELILDNSGTGRISPALATILIQHVSSPEGDNDQRRRQRYYEALMYAIRTGLHFKKGDFGTLSSKWDYDSSEDAYALACECGNRSACLAYEYHMNRKPLIFEGKRLHVGSVFDWDGLRWEANSFSKDGGLNATRIDGGSKPTRLHLTWRMLRDNMKR